MGEGNWFSLGGVGVGANGRRIRRSAALRQNFDGTVQPAEAWTEPSKVQQKRRRRTEPIYNL